MLGAAIWAALAVEKPIKAPVRQYTVGGTGSSLTTRHTFCPCKAQTAQNSICGTRQVERRGFLLLMEALAVEKIHESADARLALDAADEDVDGRGRVLCLHVGSDELCAVGCVDWAAGHAEEKRDDLVLALERPQFRGEPPQAGRRRRKALQASVLLFRVSISNLESRCQTRPGDARCSRAASRTWYHAIGEADIGSLLEATDGYSGSDMAALCREAAMGTCRDPGFEAALLSGVHSSEMRPIRLSDFEDALGAIRAGVGPGELAAFEEWNRNFGSFQSQAAKRQAMRGVSGGGGST